MSEKVHSIEVLSLAVEALLHHEKQIDRLIKELSILKENQESKQKQLSSGMERVGMKINELKAKITGLQKQETVDKAGNWSEFQSIARQAESLTFDCDEQERTFQVEARKQGQSVCFSGKVPSLDVLLKAWLAENLEVADSKVTDEEDTVEKNGEAAVPSKKTVVFTCDAHQKEST